MRAKKCDRCGEFYELNCDNDIVVCVNDKSWPAKSKTYDLCPKCLEHLNKYLFDKESIVCNVYIDEKGMN